MNSIDYAYSVAHIRAIENSLLTKADFDNMLTLSYDSALRLLSEKGYDTESDKIGDILLKRVSDAWELVLSSAPDKSLLNILLYENDFENLKTVLKGIFTDSELYRKLLLTPSVSDWSQNSCFIAEKNFSALPDEFKKCTNDAFEILALSLDSDRADAIVDSECMALMYRLAKKSGNDFILNIVKLKNTLKNIRTAYRAAAANKGANFLDLALSEYSYLNKNALIKAALEGTDAVADVLSFDGYGDAAAFIKDSYSRFEVYADDKISNTAKNSIYTSFGVEPLIAYLFKVMTEVKNIRIILTAKANKIDEGEIRARMRALV